VAILLTADGMRRAGSAWADSVRNTTASSIVNMKYFMVAERGEETELVRLVRNWRMSSTAIHRQEPTTTLLPSVVSSVGY
jgi:hypothetical protein